MSVHQEMTKYDLTSIDYLSNTTIFTATPTLKCTLFYDDLARSKVIYQSSDDASDLLLIHK